MKENFLEFNNLKQPNKTKVHSLNSIFYATANHRFARCQNMCNSKPTSQVLYTPISIKVASAKNDA